MRAASSSSPTTAWITTRRAAPRSTSRVPLPRCNQAALERARALVQPEEFLAVARPRAAPAQPPALAGCGRLHVRRVDQQQGTVGLRGLDAGEVMEHGALRLGEIAGRDALAFRTRALHVGDHAAIALRVIEPR